MLDSLIKFVGALAMTIGTLSLLLVLLGMSVEYFFIKLRPIKNADKINDRLLVIEHHLETLVKNSQK